MYTIDSLKNATERLHEIMHLIQQVEEHGAFDLVDDLHVEKGDILFQIGAMRAAGISEEFPGGECAVPGVTTPPAYGPHIDGTDGIWT